MYGLRKNFFEVLSESLAPLASGILLALSFLASEYFWWLSLIALVPLFFFLRSARTPWGGGLGAFVSGLFLIGGSFLWYWNVLPLDWLGLELSRSIFYVALSWTIVTLTLALPVGLFGAAAQYLLARGSRFELLVLPLAWVIGEYSRMWLFALLTWGEGSVLSPHFSLGFLGYLLAHHPLLLQAASFGKVYLLSFIVVFFNAGLWHLLSLGRIPAWRRIVLILLILALAAGTSLFPFSKEKSARSVTVAALHSNFPSLPDRSDQQQERDRVYRELSRLAAAASPELVVFPEDSRFLSGLSRRGELASFVEETFGASEPLLVDSSFVAEEDGRSYQRLTYYDSASRSLVTRDKVFLVPQGEYMPEGALFFAWLFGDSAQFKNTGREYHPGSGGEAIGEKEGLRVGGLFCSEIFSPGLYGALAEKQVDILVNVTSHSPLHSSRFLFKQFINMAKVRAVENRLPLVVASNASPAFAVDAYGNILGETDWEGSSLLVLEIPLN